MTTPLVPVRGDRDGRCFFDGTADPPGSAVATEARACSGQQPCPGSALHRRPAERWSVPPGVSSNRRRLLSAALHRSSQAYDRWLQLLGAPSSGEVLSVSDERS